MLQKRAAAIHDISCFGKCSLTVAIPVLSAAGIETCPIPTAMLSTHTGGFTNMHIRDLTDDVMPVAEHWKSLDFRFDAIYTGYLGSFRQIDIVSDIFDKFGGEGTSIIVDPVMADNGRLYGGITEDFPAGMRSLCSKADIITPNFTEAALMLGEQYIEGPYTPEYVEGILRRLGTFGAKTVVLTGVFFDQMQLGAAALDAATGKISYAMGEWVDGCYHGTGDTFTSALIAALLNGCPIGDALQIAVNFVSRCVRRTSNDHPYMTYGVNFEAELPSLMKALNLI